MIADDRIRLTGRLIPYPSRMWLHRFTVKPRHLDDFLPLWQEEVALRRSHGFTVHRAFVETDAEPKFTWLYDHRDGEGASVRFDADPAIVAVREWMAPHVFRNATVRPVDVEFMTDHADPSRIAVMRRYSITGSWDEFLSIWRRIVPLRERHGFDCLFAVADRPKDMFTWAFGMDGAWEDLAAAQHLYYRDRERVALRGVFDYMADYSIHPARQLPL